MNNALKLIIAIVVSELAGIIGSVFTTPSIAGWYAGLIKPALNPPAWVFGPVWTTLFVLMGISAFLIWKKGLERKDVKIALGIFIIQLGLNTLWSIIFFGLHSPGAAFLELIVLWLAILITIISFAKISRPAAWFLIPYILWVSFAGYLNYSISQLNSSVRPIEENGLWTTTTDSQTGIAFNYPKTLLTEYIHTVDWPPQVQVLNQPFSCIEAGLEIARAGQTSKRMVDDRTYCVTKESEGAAGTIYTNYAYAFPLYSTGSTQADRKTIIFTFSLRAPQCVNYDDPQKTACEKERTSFDLDSLVDRMARSIKSSYKDATYTIDGRKVKLINGFAETPTAPGSASMVTTRYFGNELKTDLNGDGKEDIAFIVTQTSGGSGTFYYAVAALNTPNGYIGSDGYLLGDRVAPQATNLSPDPSQKYVVVFNYADRRPGEPMTARPSIGKSIYLKLDPNSMLWAVVLSPEERKSL